jgi:hypothetical protein
MVRNRKDGSSQVEELVDTLLHLPRSDFSSAFVTFRVPFTPSAFKSSCIARDIKAAFEQAGREVLWVNADQMIKRPC